MPRKKNENNEKYEEIREYLKEQLITNNNYNKVTIELVDKYIKYTRMEDDLIKDVDKRGVNVKWDNRRRTKGRKKK